MVSAVTLHSSAPFFGHREILLPDGSTDHELYFPTEAPRAADIPAERIDALFNSTTIQLLKLDGENSFEGSEYVNDPRFRDPVYRMEKAKLYLLKKDDIVQWNSQGDSLARSKEAYWISYLCTYEVDEIVSEQNREYFRQKEIRKLAREERSKQVTKIHDLFFWSIDHYPKTMGLAGTILLSTAAALFFFPEAPLWVLLAIATASVVGPFLFL